MKILIAYNKHRHGGGSDVVAQTSIELLKSETNHEVISFIRDSDQLSGLKGNLKAFISGCYAKEAIASFRELLDKEKPDVVHAHELYPLISPWIFKECKKRNIPTVMTCHDYRMSCPIATHFHNGHICYECSEKNVLRCIKNNCCESKMKSVAYSARNYIGAKQRLFLDYVDLFLTPSSASRKLLIEYGKLPADRIEVLPNIIPSEAPQKNSAGDYIAFVGRMSPEKGIDVLIDAAHLAGQKLKIAGGFSEHPLYNKNDPMIEFVGKLSHKEVLEFYANARCAVVPSIWNETFGLVAGEAMTCKTPVIVSDLGALPEVVGDCGLKFTSGDKKELAEKISELFADDALCRDLGEKGRIRVEQKYNAKRHIDALLNFYCKMA